MFGKAFLEVQEDRNVRIISSNADKAVLELLARNHHKTSDAILTCHSFLIRPRLEYSPRFWFPYYKRKTNTGSKETRKEQ